MKRDIQKWKKLNNKISQCNTKFVIPYQLYKCNIGIHYNHIRKGHKENRKKEKCQIIKVVNVLLELMTLTGYTSTI